MKEEVKITYHGSMFSDFHTKSQTLWQNCVEVEYEEMKNGRKRRYAPDWGRIPGNGSTDNSWEEETAGRVQR
jgi:hypothetical protein